MEHCRGKPLGHRHPLPQIAGGDRFLHLRSTAAQKDTTHYNNAVSVLWFVTAGALEIVGILLLFLEQNSPLFIPLIFAAIIGVIAMMFTYLKIEAKYKQ